MIRRGLVKNLHDLFSVTFVGVCRQRLFLGFLGHHVGLFSILVALSIAGKRLKGLLGCTIFEWELHTWRVY